MGADAVVMVEHTNETMPGTVEVLRPLRAADLVVISAGSPVGGARCHR